MGDEQIARKEMETENGARKLSTRRNGEAKKERKKEEKKKTKLLTVPRTYAKRRKDTRHLPRFN